MFQNVKEALWMVHTFIFNKAKSQYYILLGHLLNILHFMKFLLFQIEMKTNNFFKNLVVESSMAKRAKLAGIQAINMIRE